MSTTTYQEEAAGPKPQYRWFNGELRQLPHTFTNILKPLRCDEYVAVWNIVDQRWEYARGAGIYTNNRVRFDRLPPAFRLALLLVDAVP